MIESNKEVYDMKDVFDEKTGELKEQLKELSFRMMLNEMSKLQIENSRSFDKQNGKQYSYYSDKDSQTKTENSLLLADKKGFALSLSFNELLLKNGYGHNSYENGPDAVDIWSENFLYKYDLKYPISWYVDHEDQDGLHFGYDTSDKINKNHESFLQTVEELEISDFEKKRLIGVSEYYRAKRLLLSKYHNHENIDEETKGHTK